MLILLGLGWICTRWRDPRYVAAGDVVLGRLQRRDRHGRDAQRAAHGDGGAGAGASCPALVLDSLIRRVDAALPLLARLGGAVRRGVPWAATGLALLAMRVLMLQQARPILWTTPPPTAGRSRAISAGRWPTQGSDTLVADRGPPVPHGQLGLGATAGPRHAARRRRGPRQQPAAAPCPPTTTWPSCSSPGKCTTCPTSRRFIPAVRRRPTPIPPRG